MKRLVFTGVVLSLILLLFAGCAHLAINPGFSLKPEEAPAKEEIEELNALLDAVVYPRKYEVGVFDCSNMTAYMYDFLTGKNYKCTIVLGTTSLWRLIFGDELVGRDHAWLIVQKNGKKFLVESTSRVIGTPDWYDDYFWQLRFNSLKELKRFWRRKRWHLPRGEWDY